MIERHIRRQRAEILRHVERDELPIAATLARSRAITRSVDEQRQRTEQKRAEPPFKRPVLVCAIANDNQLILL